MLLINHLAKRSMVRSTLTGSAREWMDRHVNDPYVKLALIVGLNAFIADHNSL